MDLCESARPSDDHSPWTLRCDRNYDRLFNIDRRYIVVGADGGKARLLVKAQQTSSTIAAAFIRNAAVSNADDQSSKASQGNTDEGSSQCSSCNEENAFSITQLSDEDKPRYSCRDSDVTLSSHRRSESPPLENTKSLRESLSVVLSAIYFIFVVTVGVVIGVADLIVPETNIGEIFSICLLTPGLVWYAVLHVDLLKHRHEQACADGSRSSDKDKSRGYTFHGGRHSGSFFLKIGAAGFCFGHLIHSFLMLGRQMLYFTSPDLAIRRDCGDVTALILYLLLPVYSFYQLFILFKYSNVMINRWNELARFGLMHSMATSLFFWFWSVRNETVDSLHHQQLLRDHRHQHPASMALAAAAQEDVPYLMNLTGRPTEYGHDLMRMLWSGTVLGAERCAGGSDFSALILHVSPYLYPFSIEYSISVVGIWFIMWQNVGKVGNCSRRKRTGSCSPGGDYGAGKPPPLLRGNHLVIHADCSSANRGLFAGMIVLVAVAVSIIVFFLAFSDHRYVATGIWIGLVSEFTLLLLMIVATVLAYRQLGRLDINPNPVSQLDDLLLFVCIPSFFLYGIFSIVPAMVYRNYMSLVVVILQVGQVILQTPLIINGLRRCSRSVELQASKSGRELVTFLIVCNLSMWIMETLEIKSYETNRDRIHFYGHQLWTLLSHVTLPLTLFYRFHSASCLVDIWKSAYEPPDDESEHIYVGHREP